MMNALSVFAATGSVSALAGAAVAAPAAKFIGKTSWMDAGLISAATGMGTGFITGMTFVVASVIQDWTSDKKANKACDDSVSDTPESAKVEVGS